MFMSFILIHVFFLSSRRRHTRCALVTGVRRVLFRSARSMWLILSGIAAGFGAWSTLCVTLLGYDPGVPTGSGPVGLLVSLIVSVLMSVASIYAAANFDRKLAPVAAGVIFAFGIATMHFSNLNDFRVAGAMHWDRNYLLAALAACAALASAGFAAMGEAKKLPSQFAGGSLLGGSLAAFHFLALSAITVIPKAGAGHGPIITDDPLAGAIPTGTHTVPAHGPRPAARTTGREAKGVSEP